jgi:hypothetical protein
MTHDPFEPTIAGLQVPPPYVFTGLKAFGFPMLADLKTLQDLCDEYLAIAPPSAGIKFEPIQATGLGPQSNVGVVTMQAIDYQSLIATTAPWDDFGGAPQKEIYFGIPVAQTGPGAPLGVGVYLPYVFVDNFVSVVTAREVLGFPKLLAKLVVKPTFPADAITANFTSRVAKNQPIGSRRILRVASPAGAAPPPPFNPAFPLGMFFGPLDQLFLGSPWLPQLVAALSVGIYFGYSSRTFISPDGSPDVHRSILSCIYTLSITATGPLPPATVTFSPLLGLDIAARLGIATTASGKVTATAPFVLDCDLALSNVTTLWSG